MTKNIQIKYGYDFPEEVVELFQAYTKRLVEGDPTFQSYLNQQNYEQELKDLNEKYGLPKGRLYVLFVREEAAGCVALKPINETQAELKRMYIKPEFQGNHYSDILLEQILKDAKEIGYQEILLDTLPFLEKAISLYRKHGFYEIEPYNDSPMENAIYMKYDIY